MRQSPLNYLISLGVSAALWFATAILLGGMLADSVSLQEMAVEDFLTRYRIFMGIAASFATLTMFVWLKHGSKSASGIELHGSRRFWTILLITLVVVAAALLTVLTLMLLAESLGSSTLMMIAGALILHTVAYFWICSLVLTPDRVKFVVPGSRF